MCNSAVAENIFRQLNKEGEMGESCMTHDKMENAFKIFV
jgi:hypothetical protein